MLKYDEVMNEQRKVIYKRRDQILDAADLRDEAIEYLAEAVDGVISTYCVSDFTEEWDLEGLLPEIAARTGRPTTTLDEPRRPAPPPTSSTSGSWARPPPTTRQREAEFGAETMREIERQVMLRIIDQQWREHLYEMDYLQEGINLRAMGQKDPLVEWQREGFEMFGADDAGHRPGLREVRHARPGRGGRASRTPRPPIGNVAVHRPVRSRREAPSTMAAAARAQAAAEGARGAARGGRGGRRQAPRW